MPTRSWARPSAAPLPAPRLADVTRPSALNAGGAEVTLAASCPESARQLANDTRAPFQATRNAFGSGLAYQFALAVNEPTRDSSLSRNAEPSRSGLV